jgi:hypothetical protein
MDDQSHCGYQKWHRDVNKEGGSEREGVELAPT